MADFKWELEEAFLKGLHESFPNHDNPLEIAPIPPDDVDELRAGINRRPLRF